MIRLIIFLAVIVALATGLSWLADRPGNLVINWQGYVIETSVFRAVVILAVLTAFVLFAWSLIRSIWESPAAIGSFFNRRRQRHGLDALSSGMIAIGAGDKSAATKYAVAARKSLPNEPMTHLLRAQAAQLAGDKGTARRIFEAMLSTPETEQLGLRGLFLEAEREGEREAAKQFAERAVKLNPKLGWSVDALFDLRCKDADWAGALETLSIARKHGHLDKKNADRRRAVLLTAQAQIAEDNDPERAQALAIEAHGLAPGLVPAAAIAGRLLASRGNTPKATKIIQKTWQKSPHPELAVAYAFARLGDSPRDRLERVKKLAGLNPYAIESPIAVATAAIEATDYDAAREALEPLLENRLTQRVCTLMARIEGAQHGDKGRVREWLARAVNAPRDPVWTADGVVSETWQPVSPVTGALDSFQWRVPVESAEKTGEDLIARKLEELVALGAPSASDAVNGSTQAAGAATASAVAATAAGAAAAAASDPTPAAEKMRPAPDVVDADVVDPKTHAAEAPRTKAPKTEPSETAPRAPIAQSSQDAATEQSTKLVTPKPAPKSVAAEPTREPEKPAGSGLAGEEPHSTAGKANESPENRSAGGSRSKSDNGARAPSTAEARDKTAPSQSENDDTAPTKVSAGDSEIADPPKKDAQPEKGDGSRKSAIPNAEEHAEGTDPIKQHAEGSQKAEPPGTPQSVIDAKKIKAPGSGKPANKEPEIFVSPRAPDDPGTESEAFPETRKTQPAPYRLS